MLTNLKESKYTYLALGIVAGLAVAYFYRKYATND
jgi:hypothetical protein